MFIADRICHQLLLVDIQLAPKKKAEQNKNIFNLLLPSRYRIVKHYLGCIGGTDHLSGDIQTISCIYIEKNPQRVKKVKI